MIAAVMVLTSLGLALGLLLGLTARLLAADEDPLVQEIEAMLPGSQCGQCGQPGCSAAAEAIASGAATVTCCPPGGRALVEQLAARLGIDPSTLGDAPEPLLARIDCSLCTGCTRCYKVCPTDAIVGANKQIHAVIADACTGCSKCHDICPENCIELGPHVPELDNWYWPKPEVA